MSKDLHGYIFRQQQNVQGDLAYGVFKGIVVDVRDPMQQGRVRVWIYSLHGDSGNIDVDSIPWCETIYSGRAEYSPFELWDRVIVSFEVGDRYAPIVIGQYRANPAGRGNLPYSADTGSEIRPEAWHSRSLYPEARIVDSDGPGNTIWIEGKYLDTEKLASLIQMEDTGGKQIKVRSFHTNASPYVQDDQIPSGTNLGQFSTGVNTPVRDGLSTVTDSVNGSIELNQINTSRIMQSTSSKFSTDMLLQNSINNNNGIVDISAGGVIRNIIQGNGNITQNNNGLILAGQTTSLFNQFSLPRKWN